jgi:deazaflavin-dependent oxidoreductase (nitroreductase family)
MVQFLYLTTTGRKTGLPREIEIWYVEYQGRFYILAELFEKAHFVRNLQADPRVSLRIGGQTMAATARILDQDADRELWEQVRALGAEKYGWGDGLPIELIPAGAA